MRINTILDAALLAEGYSGEFGFYWDETETPAIDQQSTSSAEAVFDGAFLEAHREVDGSLIADAPDLYTPVRHPDELAARLEAGRRAGVIYVDQPRDFASFLPDLHARLAPGAYGLAFDAHGFSAPVRQAIAAARSIEVAPGSVVIHLRGGDILHGTHSHMGTYLHKAPSVPEIVAQIERLAEKQTPVWLVGQEPDVQEALARAYPHVRAFGATHDRPPMSDVGNVFFDAVLMSRMARIFGGNSGVTLLSRRLGNVPFTDISRTLNLVSLNELLIDPMAAPRFADVATDTKAHAYVKTVIGTRPEAWQADHLLLLRLARRYRPDSKFLPLIEICLLAAFGETQAAEALGQDWLATPLGQTVNPKLGYAFLLGRDHYFPIGQTAPLAKVANENWPTLTFLATLSAHFAAPEITPKAAVLEALAHAERNLAPRQIDPVFRHHILTGAMM